MKQIRISLLFGVVFIAAIIAGCFEHYGLAAFVLMLSQAVLLWLSSNKLHGYLDVDIDDDREAERYEILGMLPSFTVLLMLVVSVVLSSLTIARRMTAHTLYWMLVLLVAVLVFAMAYIVLFFSRRVKARQTA